MQINILYEDQDIFILNKTAGVVVNQAATNKELSIQEWFAQQGLAKLSPKASWQALVPINFDASYGTPEETFARRQGLVHRLDKNTSGVLLLAKNPGALVNLLSQFKQRLTQKTYHCLVHGKLQVPEGFITAPLGRSSKDRKKFAVVAGGRTASTHYKLINEYGSEKLTQYLVEQRLKNENLFSQEKKLLETKNLRMYQEGFSLVACQPKTGRTHQIRVHMKHIGHALVGDNTYTGKRRTKTDAIWCPRQFLHAMRLEFSHPRTGKKTIIKAPLSSDLQAVLVLL